MDAELMKEYEGMAELFEEWYGINKEDVIKVFCEHGHEKVLEEPKLVGLNEAQAEDFKNMYDTIKLMDKYGGRFKYGEGNDL